MEFLKFLLALFICQSGYWTAEMNVTGISEVDAAIPEYWADGIIPDGNRMSFFDQHTGKEGSRMMVISKTGKLAQNGDQLTFNTLGQLLGAGRTGESVLKSYEEKLVIGSFTLTAEFIRHAVGITKKSTKQANFDEVQNAGTLLKEWWSRYRDCYGILTTIKDSTVVSTIYANSKTAEADLTTTDYITPAEIDLVYMALLRQGATPLQAGKVNGRPKPIFGLIMGEVETYWLMQNTKFSNEIKEAYQRFDGKNDHPMYKGALGIYRNMLLYSYDSILPIAQGTPLRPETTVYATLTTTATSLSVGGANVSTGATPDYTAFFPTTGTIQIGDEIITYSAKGYNYFTISRGASSTTAVQHVPGELVTERNVATIIGFGAGAVYEALPENAKPIGDSDDYGAHIGIGIEAYAGWGIPKDARRGKCPGLVMCKVYSKNPGTI